ncbi:MAG: phosphoglycerate dehydrogenase, partial [Thermomicrobiales bacterium]
MHVGTNPAAEETTALSLAIDIDGVLTEHPRPLAIAANERFGTNYPESAFVDSAGLNVPDEIREWVYSPSGPASRLLPAEGAPAFLCRVIELVGSDSVRIVTARPAASADMTRTWLAANGFPECEILFTDEKALAAAAVGATFAVEDSFRHARSYSAAGINCFLIVPDPATVEQIDRVQPVRVLADITRTVELLARRIQPIVESDTGWRPRIVVSDAIHPKARAAFERSADIIDVDGTDLPALLAILGDADALVVRSETQVTEEVLRAGSQLKVVSRAGVGVDNIDLDAATRAGVLVLNTPGANAISAGEHTIALLLALTRQIPFANATTHAGEWARKRVKPIDLQGKTVGIVGLGRVGSIVAKRLRAFEMHLIAYDPFITAERFTELGATSVDYDTLLTESDVITYHVPSNDVTHHMLNAERIDLLKRTAIVINAARGEVVDQVALAEAARTGRIAGAGVDVFPHEPCIESPLFGLPNVVLTPHTGGSSAEALESVGDMISSTTIAALRGYSVPNAVNMPPATLHAPELQRLTTVAAAAGHLLSVLQPELPPSMRMMTRGLVSPDIIEHVFASAVADALQHWSDRRVTPVNARVVAADLGVELRVITSTSDQAVEPEFTFEASGETPHYVKVAWDRHNAGIVEVDRFSLERALSGYVLITHHRDQPGVVGRIGTILGRHEVNIAGMQVGRRNRGGEAIMVVNIDDNAPSAAIQEIRTIPG